MAVWREFGAHLSGQYVVFKSLKPFPATPNDTDVLFLRSKRALDGLTPRSSRKGTYSTMGIAVAELVDPRGVGQVGAGKKGGTYYIDFYQEVATDYFAYMNKNRLRPFLRRGELLGAPICLWGSEPELAIILFHSVFPERTYQLEHFFLALHYMAQESFDRQSFVEFGRANGMVRALRESLAITRALHVSAFGVDPSTVEECLQRLGGRSTEGARFEANNLGTPHMFSVTTFFGSFAEKLKDLHSLRSLGVQLVQMLRPRFFLDVVRSLRARLSEKGVYHQE